MPHYRAGEKLEAGIFKPLNASFSSRGKARGRDLHSSCRSRRIGYTAPADSATGKGHLHNLHSKMDKNLAHKYLQLPAMARKSCKTPNLRRIYKNLRELRPLFEEFTKSYVNLQRKLLRPPALPPFVVGLPSWATIPLTGYHLGSPGVRPTPSQSPPHLAVRFDRSPAGGTLCRCTGETMPPPQDLLPTLTGRVPTRFS